MIKPNSFVTRLIFVVMLLFTVAAWALGNQLLYGDWSCAFKNCAYVIDK